jgi:hypothetical protein
VSADGNTPQNGGTGQRALAPEVERRRRILTRVAPLCALAALAFAAGLVIGGGSGIEGAERFLDAWERGDYAAMHDELAPEAQAEYTGRRKHPVEIDLLVRPDERRSS